MTDNLFTLKNGGLAKASPEIIDDCPDAPTYELLRIVKQQAKQIADLEDRMGLLNSRLEILEGAVVETAIGSTSGGLKPWAKLAHDTANKHNTLIKLGRKLNGR